MVGIVEMIDGQGFAGNGVREIRKAGALLTLPYSQKYELIDFLFKSYQAYYTGKKK